jgi:cation transport ATPase
MRNPLSPLSPAERIAEDQVYERVYAEIASGQMDMAAQARAIEEGGGDDGLVKKAYIRYRVSRIKSEIELAKDQAKLERFEREKEAERLRHEEKKNRAKEAKEEAKRIAANNDPSLRFILLAGFFLLFVLILLALVGI